MSTAIQHNSKVFSLGNVISGLINSTGTQSVAKTEEREEEVSHAGHSIAHFVWTYVMIFTVIGTAVVIAEKFFFV